MQITDYNNLEEWSKKIPLEQIAVAVKTKLGMPINSDERNFFKISIERVGKAEEGKGLISISSYYDFADSCGIMSSVYKEVRITDFGITINFNDETKEITMFMPLHFSFKYKTGGSNGVEICRVKYNFTNKILNIS